MGNVRTVSYQQQQQQRHILQRDNVSLFNEVVSSLTIVETSLGQLENVNTICDFMAYYL